MTISVDLLRDLVRYDEATGALFWRERPPHFFSTESFCTGWNKRYAGKPALACPGTRGYLHGAIFDKKYKAHRVAWALVNGVWPAIHIDHIDGNTSNNRIQNLREANASINQKNKSRLSSNTSGICGVTRVKRDGKWRGRIVSEGKTYSLGCFVNKSDAAKSRKAAEEKFGFTERHGCPPT